MRVVTVVLLLIFACCLLFMALPAESAEEDEVAVGAPRVESAKSVGVDGVQRTNAIRNEIERRDAALDRAFARLDQSIALIRNADFLGEQASLQEFREIVRIMKPQVDALVDDHHVAERAAKEFGKSLERGIPEFGRRAQEFRNFARNEPFSSLQDDYERWAETFEGLVAKYEERKKEIDPTVRTVKSNLGFTLRTQLYLERLDNLLDIVPEETTDNREFFDTLGSYVANFNELRKRVGRLHEKTSEERSQEDGTALDVELPVDKEASGRGERKDAVVKAEGVRRVGARIVQAVSRAKRNRAPRLKSVEKDASRMAADAPVPPAPKMSLSGLWQMGSHKKIVFRFNDVAGRVRVSLSSTSHGALKGVRGELRHDGERLHIGRLAYTMRNGQSIDLSRNSVRLLDKNTIEMTGPDLIYVAYRKIGLSSHTRTVTLRRIEQ